MHLRLPLFCLLFLTIQCAHGANLERLVDGDWIKARSDHFILITDTSERQAKVIIQDLEDFRHLLINKLNLNVINEMPPLHILAISNNRNFRSLGLHNSWAGLLSSSPYGQIAVANIQGYRDGGSSTLGRQTLLHEYFHYLARITHEDLKYPSWFDEGMATYWGTYTRSGNTATVGLPGPAIVQAFGLERRAGQIGSLYIEDLFTQRDFWDHSMRFRDVQDSLRLYSRSFFTVHYLNSSAELEQAMYRYVYLTNIGMDVETAFRAAFGKSFVELDRDIQRYLNRNRNLIVRNFTIGEQGYTPSTVNAETHKLTEAEAHGELARFIGGLGGSVIDRDKATAMLQQAMALNPDQPHLPVHLARLEQPRRDWSNVGKHLIAQFPESAEAHTLYADGLAYHSELAQSAGLNHWKNDATLARSHYRRALSLDNFYGGAYHGIGYLYNLMDNSEPLQEGVIGFASASLYSPSTRYNYYRGLLLSRLERSEEAAMALQRFFSTEGYKGSDIDVYLLMTSESMRSVLQQAPTAIERGLQYYEGSLYSGETKNGLPHGKGVLTRLSGSRYEGNFVDGQMHGQGALKSDSGRRYQGELSQGRLSGSGRLFDKDSTVPAYAGEFLDGRPHGTGTMRYTNGQVYEGQFESGARHGKGALLSDGNRLEGSWLYDRYTWELSDDKYVFVGGVDEQLQPSGWGVCYEPTERQPFSCSAKD